MNTLGVKKLQNGTIWTGLHGITNRETISVGKGKAFVSVVKELLFRVSVEWRSLGSFDALFGHFGSEEDRCCRVAVTLGHVELCGRG